MAIALLSEVNYEGFDEEGDLLRAYIPSHLYDERELRMFAKNQKLSFSVEKMGASRVIAVDCDLQSIENATDNFVYNNCKQIDLVHSCTASGNNQCDIILSNIIKSVILENLPFLVRQLAPGGNLLLSGLLASDYKEILLVAIGNGLILRKKFELESWLGLQMTHI